MSNEQSQASASRSTRTDTHPIQTRQETPSTAASKRAAQLSFSARLYEAVVAGNYPDVKSLVDEGLNLDHCHAQNDPPILAAMRCDHRDAGSMVQLLALSGAHPAVVSQIDGACVLTLAIPRGQLSTISVILEHPGVQIHRPDNNGMTAYRLAEQCAYSPTGEAIFEMIKRHDQLHTPAPASMTPAARLCRAATMGDLEGVETYLDAGGDPDVCDGLNAPPLLIAAQSKHPNARYIVELLSKAGADPNVACRISGDTPLIVAIQRKEVGMVSHLLNNPMIKIQQADKSGKSAYQQANKHAVDPDGTAIFKLVEAHHRAQMHQPGR